MTQLQFLIVRHRRLLRAAWLIAVLALVACQPDSGGGNGGGDGY
jgi:hypothetical protein